MNIKVAAFTVSEKSSNIMFIVCAAIVIEIIDTMCQAYVFKSSRPCMKVVHRFINVAVLPSNMM